MRRDVAITPFLTIALLLWAWEAAASTSPTEAFHATRAAPPRAITFEMSSYKIEGLTPDSIVVDDAILAPLRPHGVRVALLVRNGQGKAMKVSLLVADLGPTTGRAVQTVFRKSPADPFGLAEGHICAVDLYHNGRKELFVYGSKPDQTLAFQSRDGKYESMGVPFPRLYDTKMVWLDYKQDGWPGLFLWGMEKLPGGHAQSSRPCQVRTLSPLPQA
jgi:hypothetical protein